MSSRLSSVLLLVFLCTGLSQADTHSESQPDILNRSKRFLIFEGTGTCKLVFGISTPMNLLDRRPFRTLTLSYNIHLQFAAPTRPLYWWTYFVNSTVWAHARHSKTLNGGVHRRRNFVGLPVEKRTIAYDVSRAFVFKALEVFFQSKGLPGERCLLRVICELSQRPLHEDSAISGIVNAIFRPTEPNIEEKYLHATRIGAHNADCGRVYWSCVEGMKWLSRYLRDL